MSTDEGVISNPCSGAERIRQAIRWGELLEILECFEDELRRSAPIVDALSERTRPAAERLVRLRRILTAQGLTGDGVPAPAPLG